jgi:hypothetical protein
LTKKVVTLVVCLTVVMCVLSSRIQAQASGEYQVKAAFLYNFLKFVDWPAQSFANDSSPFIIGVVGNDTFNSAIDQAVSGKTANGRPIVIKRFASSKTLSYCHILFISPSERDRFRQILGTTGSGVLTVSETDGFAQIGGIVNFTLVDSKVRFEINQSAAERAGLKISAKLLSLARVVRD